MFRSFLIVLVLSWILIAGCEKKQAEKMDKSKSTMKSVTDSTDTTSTMAEPEAPDKE